MQKNFFESMAAFADFSEACKPEHYHPAPDDWRVVVTDVVNSTVAIRNNKYKDVNLAGAAGIAAVLNSCKGITIPYVFGGDGATLLIPPAQEQAVREALVRTRMLCKSALGLELRVGIIPVSDIRKAGSDFRVARYNLRDKLAIAMFGGGGVAVAENMIKQHPQFCITEDGTGHPPLEGLSCRWQPLKSNRGHMLTLLVKSRHGDAIYQDVIKSLRQLSEAPVTAKNAQFAWPARGVVEEAKLQRKGRSFFLHLLGLYAYTLMVWVMMKTRAKAAITYHSDVIINSDYQKFDDMLRMVIDCTPGQAEKIRTELEQKRDKGELFFGIHLSDEALMTCLVFTLESDGHVHFIDGADGGYAAAATELKGQMKQVA